MICAAGDCVVAILVHRGRSEYVMVAWFMPPKLVLVAWFMTRKLVLVDWFMPPKLVLVAWFMTHKLAFFWFGRQLFC